MPVRSRWKNQFVEVESASNFHNKVRLLLATDPILRGFNCYQEVPVRDLVPEYPDTHFYDWFIDELGLVVELHGQQHYKVVNYGNISYAAAQRQFKDIQRRDSQKKRAAQEEGYTYLEISYKLYPKLTAAGLKDLLFGVVNEAR